MKPIKDQKVERATRQFTDRVKPLAAFWRKYEQLSNEMSQDDPNIHILTYYGIGGIGKTRLLKKITEEIDCKKVKYCLYDFEISVERIKVLNALKSELTSKYKFKFPLFVNAERVYKKKIGEEASEIKVERFLDRNPVVSTAKGVLDFIPGVSDVVKVLDLGDAAIANIRTYKKNNKKQLKYLETKKAKDIYEYDIIECFILDMKKNLAKQDTPFVILLDTYELLVNELSQTGEVLLNDVWLRRIIESLPNVLWVISGREKIKWGNEWENVLEQHILGCLSKIDSCTFLFNSGVENEGLCNELYQLTNGTPLYLDICVDAYLQLKAQGKDVSIDDFGEDTTEIVARFVRYMDDATKELVYKMVCLGNWSDELFVKLFPEVNIVLYNKTKKISLVVEENGLYHIHKIVREILLKNCDSNIKHNVANILIKKYEIIMRNEKFFDEDYEDALKYMLRAIMLKFETSEELNNYFDLNIANYIEKYLEEGFYQQVEDIILLLDEYVDFNKDNRMALNLLWFKSLIEFKTMNYQKSLFLAEKFNNSFAELESNDVRKAKLYFLLGKLYSELSQSQNAEKFYQNTIKLRKQLVLNDFEAYGVDLVESYLTLGSFYSDYDNSQSAEWCCVEALKISKELYEKKYKKGLECLSNSCNNLGVFYCEQGEYLKAEKYLLKSLEIDEKLAATNPEKYNVKLVTIYNNLANIYSRQKNFHSAENYYIKVLAIIKKLTDENPDRYNWDLSLEYANITTFYLEAKETKKAEKYSHLALEVMRKIESDAPAYFRRLSYCYNLLGAIYDDLNDYKNSELYYIKSIDVLKKLVEVDSVKFQLDLSASYNNLGCLYAKIGRCTEAINTYKISKEIVENLAVNNPEKYNAYLVDCCLNISECYEKQEDYIGAESQLLSSLELIELLVKENPERFISRLLIAYNCLININDEKNDLNNLIKYILKSIAILEGLSEENPQSKYYNKLGQYYHKIATCYSNVGDFSNAPKYYLKANDFFEKMLEKNCSDGYHWLAFNSKDLADFYYKQNEYKKAENYYIKAIGMMEKQETEDSITVDLSLGEIYKSLLTIYEQSRDCSKIESCSFKLIELYERSKECSPKFYFNLGVVYNDIAMVYDNMEQYSKAEKYYIKAIDFMDIMPKENLVKYYCDLGISYKNLALIYEKQNDFLKSEKCYLRAINALKKSIEPNLEVARFHLTDAYNAISYLYKKQGENEKAKKYVLKAVEVCEILVSKCPEGYNGNLATTYMLCGRITKDRVYFAKAREIANNFPDDPTCKLILDNID